MRAVLRRWRRLRRWPEKWLFDLGFAIIPALPRRAVVALARGAGWLAYHLARRDRRIALANLDLAYGDSLPAREKAEIAKQSFRTFALVLLDFFWFTRQMRERVERYVVFDKAVVAWFGNGPLIAVTAHFGNWEVMGKSAAFLGMALASVAKPQRNPMIDARLNRMRAATGQRVIPREGALKALLKILREHGTVALLLDQDTRLSEGGVFVRFFGVPVPMSNAAAALALKTNAPIITAFCAMQPGGHYRVYVSEPLQPADIKDLSPAELTQRIAGMLEQEIRREPGQWLWMYKRWKRRMPGFDPARYPFYADS